MPPRTRRRAAQESTNSNSASAPALQGLPAGTRTGRVTRSRANKTGSGAPAASIGTSIEPVSCSDEQLDQLRVSHDNRDGESPENLLSTPEAESSEDHISRMLQIERSLTDSVDEIIENLPTLCGGNEPPHRELSFSLPPSSPPLLRPSSPISGNEGGRPLDQDPAPIGSHSNAESTQAVITDPEDPFGFFAAQKRLLSIRSVLPGRFLVPVQAEQAPVVEKHGPRGDQEPLALQSATSSLPSHPPDDALATPPALGGGSQVAGPRRTARRNKKQETSQSKNEEQENIDHNTGRSRRSRPAGASKQRGKAPGSKGKSSGKAPTQVSSTEEDEEALLEARQRRLQHYKDLESYMLEEELVI